MDKVSVSLNLSLAAPVAPYGDIVVYQVVVLKELPLEGEDPLTLNLLKETELQVCVHYCKTKLGNFSIISLVHCTVLLSAVCC